MLAPYAGVPSFQTLLPTSFMLMQTLGNNSDGSSEWVLATVGDTWLQCLTLRFVPESVLGGGVQAFGEYEGADGNTLSPTPPCLSKIRGKTQLAEVLLEGGEVWNGSRKKEIADADSGLVSSSRSEGYDRV